MDIIDRIKSELEASTYIDINGEYSDWVMIGKWMEDNEDGWHFPDIAWNYIEATIEAHIENSPAEEVNSLMQLADDDWDEAAGDFIDREVLSLFIQKAIINTASTDYLKAEQDNLEDFLEGKKLFYNPIWMPAEEDIQILGCYIPEDLVINDVKTYLEYLKDRYRKIIIQAFYKHGKTIFHWYYDFIEDVYAYGDETDLVDRLFESDKFYYQISLLKERVDENKMPDYIVGTSEIELIDDLHDLFLLINERYL